MKAASRLYLELEEFPHLRQVKANEQRGKKPPGVFIKLLVTTSVASQ